MPVHIAIMSTFTLRSGHHHQFIKWASIFRLEQWGYSNREGLSSKMITPPLYLFSENKSSTVIRDQCDYILYMIDMQLNIYCWAYSLHSRGNVPCYVIKGTWNQLLCFPYSIGVIEPMWNGSIPHSTYKWQLVHVLGLSISLSDSGSLYGLGINKQV